MPGIAKVATIVAMAMTGAAVSDYNSSLTRIPAAEVAGETESVNPQKPVILQSRPEGSLNCAVESARQFEPNRRAFVMKKVMVCR